MNSAASDGKPKGIFVTGTDTGVGKTLVSCAVLAALRARGLDVAAFKPAETGCSYVEGAAAGEDCWDEQHADSTGCAAGHEDADWSAAAGRHPQSAATGRPLRRELGVDLPAETPALAAREGRPARAGERRGRRLEGEDCRRLAAAAQSGQSAAELAAYLFAAPAAPLAAAEHAGENVDPDLILERFRDAASGRDFVLVEGAGGLLVPIAEGFTYLELAEALGLPVLCVVGSRLGCINHALLSLGALGRAEVPVAGYVINSLSPGSARQDRSAPADLHEHEHAVAESSNRDLIARFTDCIDLGAFPFVAPDCRNDYARLGALAEAHLNLDRILGACR